jgi:hypothetical protein
LTVKQKLDTLPPPSRLQDLAFNIVGESQSLYFVDDVRDWKHEPCFQVCRETKVNGLCSVGYFMHYKISSIPISISA